MVKKISEIMSAVLILVTIVLSGCSKVVEPEVAKTGNINQTPTTLNNNINNNAVSANNNTVSVNSPNYPTSVANNIPATIANKDNKKSLPAVKEPIPQIGSGGGDLSLFTQARGALSSDQELINAVIIEIKEGNATLTGNVSSEAQKTKAGRIVQSINGIKSVKNNLRVSS